MAFFEQIGKKLTDAGQNVAQQTKNLADRTQLGSAISEKERNIAQLCSALGREYYEAHKADESCEFAEKVARINALYAEIAQNREKISQIKGVVKCESCGADVPANAAFCNACGTKVVRPEPPAAPAAPVGRVCPACGCAVGEENAFCNHCGAKLDAAE